MPESELSDTSIEAQPSALSDFTKSLAYSLIQSPLTGAAQRVDKISGTEIAAKIDIIDAPREAKAYSINWFAQQIGSGLGMLPTFVAVARITKSEFLKAGLRSEAVFVSDTLKAKPAIAVAESAVAGFVYNFGLTPMARDSKQFWQDAFKSGIEGAATFGALSATALALKSAGKHTQSTPLSHLSKPLPANVLSGITAGAVAADGRELLTNGRLAASDERAKAIVGMVTVGLALPAVHKSMTRMTDNIHLKYGSGLSIDRYATYQRNYTAPTVLLPDFMKGYKVKFEGKGEEQWPAQVKISNRKGDIFVYSPAGSKKVMWRDFIENPNQFNFPTGPREGSPLQQFNSSSEFLFAGTPSRQFVEQSKAAYDALPHDIKTRMKENEVKTIVVGDMGEYDSRLLKITPSSWRVYGGEHTYAHVRGFASADKIVVAERTLDFGGSGQIKFTSYKGLPGLFAHEAGHTIDFAGRSPYSRIQTFGAAYEADVSRLSPADRKRFAYFVQDHVPANPNESAGRRELFRRYLHVLQNSLESPSVNFTGRSEVYAELIADRSGVGMEGIADKFSNSAAFVKRNFP